MGNGTVSGDGTAMVNCAYVCPQQSNIKVGDIFRYALGTKSTTITLPPNFMPGADSVWFVDQEANLIYQEDFSASCMLPVGGPCATYQSCFYCTDITPYS